MTPILAPDTLPAEVAVVILEPLDAYPWLREHGWTADGRDGRVRSASPATTSSPSPPSRVAATAASMPVVSGS